MVARATVLNELRATGAQNHVQRQERDQLSDRDGASVAGQSPTSPVMYGGGQGTPSPYSMATMTMSMAREGLETITIDASTLR